MTRSELVESIRRKRSFLCIGLDSDADKIPAYLQSHPDFLFEFNRHIIDATKEFCVAYKINTAFYEALGIRGWELLKKTFDYIPEDIFKIADAKRGDIGNTSTMYAQAFFVKEKSGFDFDAITVAPYMGEDSVTPFLKYENKWVIMLALTSNRGAADFQLKRVTGDNDREKQTPEYLFEKVIRSSLNWGTSETMMYVVGATRAEMLKEIRNIIPDHFLLVPGVGAQGGSLEDVAQYGMNKECGLLVNVSRDIIYASGGKDFAEGARKRAAELKNTMSRLLETYSAKT